MASDYQALVEKRPIKSLSSTRQANECAQRLLRLQPPFYDAYVSAGISEYLLGSLPFFIRWFVHFNNVQGGEGQAVQDLELVERQRLYLKPFARILLAIVSECGGRRLPGEVTQLAGSQYGGSFYTERDLKAQNGNSGQELLEGF